MRSSSRKGRPIATATRTTAACEWTTGASVCWSASAIAPGSGSHRGWALRLCLRLCLLGRRDYLLRHVDVEEVRGDFEVVRLDRVLHHLPVRRRLERQP